MQRHLLPGLAKLTELRDFLSSIRRKKIFGRGKDRSWSLPICSPRPSCLSYPDCLKSKLEFVKYLIPVILKTIDGTNLDCLEVSGGHEWPQNGQKTSYKT